MRRGRRNSAAVAAAITLTQFLAAALSFCAPEVCAQQLPFRPYDVADGLAHSRVTSVHQDGKGYMWFGTWEGLSRFDGYRFANYGVRDGLGNQLINTIIEDRRGRLWVGTNGGIARLIDDPRAVVLRERSEPDHTPRRKFVSYRVGDSRRSNEVYTLLFDAGNNLWCGTAAGIYRARATQSDDFKFEIVVSSEDEPEWLQQAFADSRGRLWFVTETALIEIVQGGFKRHTPPAGFARWELRRMTEDRQGRLLVANWHEVFEFVAPTDANSRGEWKRFPVSTTADQGINAMSFDSDDVLWIGTRSGLIRYAGGRRSIYATAQGLCDNHIRSLGEDREGNLWISTDNRGVCKLSGEEIISITTADGLPFESAGRVIQARDGRIYAGGSGIAEIIDGKAVPVPGAHVPPFHNVNRRILQDRRGDWWVGTNEGLFWFKGPELQFRHGRKFTLKDGISEKAVFSGPGMYEDSAGRIWISSSDNNLYWFDPARKEPPMFQHIPVGSIPPLDMFEDQSGALWLARYGAMLGRLVNGEYLAIQPTEGLPETEARAFYRDSRGWLWIGLRYKGVSVTTDPLAEPLKFTNYSTADGLASDVVRCVVEDDAGRMYFGTGRGLDRLDLTNNRIQHFTSADGLAGNEIWHCLKDRKGYIWLATNNGFSRFDPRAERKPEQPPPIYLSRIQVAGKDLLLPETGASRVSELTLPPSSNNILVEYVGLSFWGGEDLKYQYRLEGVDTDWSLPGNGRAINYARLAPGSYRFMVRVMNEDGAMSPEPAVFQFRIMPPVWQRWWFLTLSAMLVGAAIYSLYRYRVARLIELERVRTRIATDLHDDIGSGLSQIAILSEVVRQRLERQEQVGASESLTSEQLSLIGRVSRELVDSMSDIVWAINPHRDHLDDLTKRMRRFASDVFTARDIRFRFRVTGTEQDTKLDAEVRRQVFLIFKESVNNIVRHAACSEVSIEFDVADGWLELEVSDDGRGFDLARESSGHGVASMRGRAKRLGGALRVTARTDEGTTLTLRVPLGPRPTLRR